MTTRANTRSKPKPPTHLSGTVVGGSPPVIRCDGCGRTFTGYRADNGEAEFPTWYAHARAEQAKVNH